MIVEMDSQFPFGRLQLESGIHLTVRRIVPYTRLNYTVLKQKFELGKQLNHTNIVRLQRVLEEEGRFHLMYEYVAQPLLNSNLSYDCLQKLKTKLMYMCAYLAQKKILTNLRAENLGVDEDSQFKYYIDPEFRVMTLESEAVRAHTHYLQQVQKLCEELVVQINVTDISSEPKTSFVRKSPSNISQIYTLKSDRSRKREAEPSRKSRSPTSNNSSIGSNEKVDTVGRYRPIENALQMLNSIEKKLEQLKQSLKRSPKGRSPPTLEKSPPQTEIKIEAPPIHYRKQMQHSTAKKEKSPESRKYSGEIRHIMPLARRLNVAESARSVRQPHQNRSRIDVKPPAEVEIDDGKRDLTYISMASSIQSRKYPVEDRKTPHFPKMDIHRKFLQDEQELVNVSPQQQSPPDLLPKEPLSQALISSTATQLPANLSDNKQLQQSKSPINSISSNPRARGRMQHDLSSESRRNQKLQQRISQALKKSDQAIKVYRKHSIHSINAEFGKKNS